MSDGRDDGKVASVFYEVARNIPDKSWKEFVRVNLGVAEHRIEEIEADNPRESREQKFKMLKQWQTDQGPNFSLNKLKNIVDDFNCPRSTPRSYESSEERSVVMVFDENVSPQIEKAKELLKSIKSLKVNCIPCKSNTERLSLEKKIPDIENHAYRVYILTGRFQISILPTFMPLLQQSTSRNTLLIARKPNIPEEISHLTLRTTDRIVCDQIHALVTGFIFDRSRSPSLTDPMSRTGNSDALDVEESSDDTEDPEEYEKYEKILEHSGFPTTQYDGKYANVLILGPVRGPKAELRSLARIPWLRVFDFDPKSRVLGILSNVESTLKSIRYYTTSDRKDKIDNLEERKTNWVFINGYCDDSDFSDFAEPLEISEEVIFGHCDSLVNYCKSRKVLRVIVLWYASSSNYDERLDNLLSSFRYHFKSQLQSFNCTVYLPSKPHKSSARAKMLKRLKLEQTTEVVPLDILCLWIKRSTSGRHSVSSTKTLPQFSGNKGEAGTFHLSEKDSKWLDVCFDVLPSNDIDIAGADIADREGVDFLKGGKLGWGVIATGKYDAARDSLQEKVELVTKQYIETGKSGIITIFHPPGGGGTTFARRLLFELRKHAPCLELLSMELSIDEVKNRLSFIRNETHLPAVLLIDGNSHLDVKTLLETCRYEKIVILHVQRFYSAFRKSKNRKKADLIFVPEIVSPSEANRLLDIFSSVRPDQKQDLERLTREVESGTSRCMFEYGLTAYDADFRGVKRYVHGNLQISPDKKELEPWHKVLTYLSLAYYYGHCGLPSKLFSSLLQKKFDDIVNLGDLPHQARKFVIEENSGDWRITYYIVAKEILEQVLVKRQEPEYHQRGKSLTHEARLKLSTIAIDFIGFVKDNLGQVQAKEMPEHIQNILTSVLIKRNYKDAGENDEFGNKSKYSRLIEDAVEDYHKGLILETLVSSFPYHAEFHAHLGRFYGITKKFAEAEQCFFRAFEVRQNKKVKGSGDPVLHRIHSMYGFYLNERVRNDIALAAKSLGNKQEVAEILRQAKEAVLHFQKSKNYYQKGCNPTYVYVGEIKVRLLLAGFAHRISSGNIANLREEHPPFSTLADFVFKSFSHCDQLLVQCMYHAEEGNVGLQEELEVCINQFNTFFKDSEMALRNWMGKDKTVYSKKCHVSVLKIQMTKPKGNSHKFKIYEDVRELPYLQKLIDLYEGIFNDANGRDANHYLISNYMTEWLQAIRHELLEDQDYSLTHVNTRVEGWDLKNERGSLATFYHYVLTTLLAIQGPRGEVTNTYSEQSCILKERIKDCMIPLPLIERTAEWLANCSVTQSFRNLIHRNLLGEWDGKFWKKEKAALLKVCKGRISTCKIWYGHIVLDGGQKPEITVFFNPQRYGFSGSDGRQKIRVEFYVGFNPNHGAEAYQVTILEKHLCAECGTPTEISKLGRKKSEWGGRCPKCDREVSVREGQRNA